MTSYSAQIRKQISYSGCLCYLGQQHDPRNTLCTMALELLLPGFRTEYSWGEEGLLWVWSPEFVGSGSEDTKLKDISWLVQCAEPPFSSDLTMIGFLHGWFSSVFMLSRATGYTHGYTQTFTSEQEIASFLEWTPDNPCPNIPLRDMLEKKAKFLDKLLMQESESEESPDLQRVQSEDDEHEHEDENEILDLQPMMTTQWTLSRKRRTATT